ncbi:MAG: cell division protein FtsL [Desulfuromonadaceae bacterium]
MSNATVRSLPKLNTVTVARPRLLSLFLFLAVLLVVSLFFVWSRITVVNLEYDISSLSSRLREMEQENQKLRLEAAHLRNPIRLEQVARTKLGLRMPTLEQVVIID